MKELFVNVIVNIASDHLDHTFSYRVPESLRDRVFEGCRVKIPFGKGDNVREGYVMSLSTSAAYRDGKIKSIIDVDEEAVTVEQKLIRLAAWLRHTYGGTMYQAIKTVMPVREKKRAQIRKYLHLTKSEEETVGYQKLCEEKHFTAKARLLGAVLEEDGIEQSRAQKECNVSLPVVKKLVEEGYLFVSEKRELRLVYTPKKADRKIELTEEQQECCEGILSEWKEKNRPVLIQGVTGSGKTLVYMKLIEEVQKEGRTAIMLVPEIALTWQMINRFSEKFGDRVALLHSKLTDGEKSDLYDRIRSGEADIVLGPRSALFSPLNNIGLIIVDEEHDDSYISDMMPKFHARETAIERAKIEAAHIILGSATPSVSTRYACDHGDFGFFRLQKRYGLAHLPEISIVNMKEELKNGNDSILSKALRRKIQERLDAHEQIMLFLNRRGYSGHFFCRSCGYVIKCPHCDVAMTLHIGGKLKCHYCERSVPVISKCPNCGSSCFGGVKDGTQKVEKLLTELFPGIRVLRLDRDSATTRGKYEHILKSFESLEADVLVGTQMIVKGHDFPKVTLVGVLNADTALYAGDYRASEKTFELLTQAVGRAGRGEAKGEALIQTYHPEHFVIDSVLRQDYETFYNDEVRSRDLCLYPPYGHLLAIRGQCTNEATLIKAMQYIRAFAERIRKKEGTSILGPGPEEIYKVKDAYRRILYIKEENLDELIRMRKLTEQYIEMNSGFETVGFRFDLDY